MAGQVNRQSGGAVIAPWEIAGLLEEAPEWIFAAQALEQYQCGLPGQQKANAIIEQKLAAWRNSHPAYRGKYQ
jgi:hypothetical protein